MRIIKRFFYSIHKKELWDHDAWCKYNKEHRDECITKLKITANNVSKNNDVSEEDSNTVNDK